MSNTGIYPPVAPDVFGPIVTARDVRLALDSTIQTWSATYIAELAATTGLPLTPFGQWSAQWTDRALPADQTAACWTTCTTTDPKTLPDRQGDGTYRATWLAQAHIVLRGGSWNEAADLIAVYMAAVRVAVLQHRSLGGFAASTAWRGEASKQIDTQPRTTIMTGVIQFSILVGNVTYDRTSPPQPTTQPGTQAGPTIQTVDLTYTKTGVD